MKLSPKAVRFPVRTHIPQEEDVTMSDEEYYARIHTDLDIRISSGVDELEVANWICECEIAGWNWVPSSFYVDVRSQKMQAAGVTPAAAV